MQLARMQSSGISVRRIRAGTRPIRLRQCRKKSTARGRDLHLGRGEESIECQWSGQRGGVARSARLTQRGVAVSFAGLRPRCRARRRDRKAPSINARVYRHAHHEGNKCKLQQWDSSVCQRSRAPESLLSNSAALLARASDASLARVGEPPI